MICAQTKIPGVSVSQVARRYDMNANLLFIWLRDERYQVDPTELDAARFLPVEVIDAEPRSHRSLRLWIQNRRLISRFPEASGSQFEADLTRTVWQH